MGLRTILDDLEPHFEKGGRFEKWYALYEAVDTIFYSPGSVTKTTAHVRDGVERDFWHFLTKDKINPVIYKVFDMDEIEAAHELMKSSAHIGKIVVRTGV